MCIGHGCEHSSWLCALPHGCVHSSWLCSLPHGYVYSSWLCSLPHGYVYSLPVVDISPESKCRVLSYSLQTLGMLYTFYFNKSQLLTSDSSETLLLLLSTVIYCSPCSNRNTYLYRRTSRHRYLKDDKGRRRCSSSQQQGCEGRRMNLYKRCASGCDGMKT
jgi:hypothetical protein